MSDTDRLYRARAYPYDSPRFSFTYLDGEILPFDLAETEGRTAVLAFGSNKSPEQLCRKFGHLRHCRIPVEMITLHDFDVVFAAHITSYGALPAMLQHCPGTAVDVAISWLDDNQLQLMHATELYAANYSYALLEGLVIDRQAGQCLNKLYAYIGEKGHFSLTKTNPKEAVAIASIEAKNRIWPAYSCAEMLCHLHDLSQANQKEDAFILRLIDDVEYRRNLSKQLDHADNKFRYPYQVIL